MTRPYIEGFLPVFMVFFMLVFLVWIYNFHKRIQKRKESYLSSITRNNQFFLVMLGLAFLIVGLYSFHPDYYSFLLPIDSLDKPFINDMGIFILRIAFFWLLSAMIYTALLFRTIQKENKKSPAEVLVYAQKIVLVSVSLMLVGLAITISSIGAFLLSLVGVFTYGRIYQ